MFINTDSMEGSKVIWDHEVDQSDKIARSLIEAGKVGFSWRIFFFPSELVKYIRYRRSLFLTRKNLLFTKQLAFEAAKEIFQGKDRALEIDSIEIKTKEFLRKDEKRIYTEKIRRKQLHEIELLIDHYLLLFNSNKSGYAEMIEAAYQSKKEYLSFLDKLQQIEEEVIHAAIVTVQRESRKDRLIWFRKVQDVSMKTRMEEVERIFP